MTTIEFNGSILNDYMIINSVDRGIGSPRTNNTKKIGNSHGVRYESYTLDEPKITVEFTLIYDVAKKRREIAGIMDVSEPTKLIFGDEPDKYYLAVPDGEIDFDDSRRYGSGTITWVVPDAMAHSTEEKEFPAAINSEGIMEATIYNEGTDPVPIDYTIHNNHDNGYVGIVTPDTVLQIGRIAEVDEVPYQQSEVLINTNTFDGWEKDTSTHPENSAKYTKGDLQLNPYNGQNILQLSNPGGTSGLNGGMISIDIPADSEGEKGAQNFWCYFNCWFETGAVGQTSSMSVNFLDENDELIFCYIIEKNTLTNNKAHVMLRAGGSQKRHYFEDDFEPSAAVYGKNMFDWNRGNCDVVKMGSTVGGYFYGVRKTINVPDLAEKKCCKIQLYIGQYDRNPVLTGSAFRSLTFQKHNVEKWEDVPNRFPAGSTIEVDGRAGKVYTDGLLRPDDEVRGSDYPLAPPGESKVQFYYSDFADPAPTITTKIREGWL